MKSNQITAYKKRIEREKCRRSLKEFFKGAWHVLEPGRVLHWSFHMEVICDHLEAMINGKFNRLVVNLPPGFSKSMLISVIFPVWTWIDYPEKRFLTASYARAIATRDSLRSRTLIQSDWFQNHWGVNSDWRKSFKLTQDSNEKMRYTNDKTGFRISASVGGSATGERGDITILDDPMKIEDAYNDTAHEDAKNWIKNVWSARKNSLVDSLEITIMQRLHTNDPSGYLLGFDNYEHVRLPMRYDMLNKGISILGVYDTRTEHGELLDPVRFPAVVVDEMEEKLGSFGTAAQHQQNPKSETTDLFQYHHFRFYIDTDTLVEDKDFVSIKTAVGTLVDCELIYVPHRFKEVVQSWDFSFGGKDQSSSQVAGHVYGIFGETFFLLDRIFKHMSFTQALKSMRDMHKKWPNARKKLVEAKANGPAIISSVKESISGVIPIHPKDSKLARAHATLPIVEAGNLVLPHPKIAPWVYKYLEYMTQFPLAEYDDDVDTTTQMINHRLNAPIVTIS